MMSRSMSAMVGRPHMLMVASSSSGIISRLGIVLSGFHFAGRILRCYLGRSGGFARLVSFGWSNSWNPSALVEGRGLLLALAKTFSDRQVSYSSIHTLNTLNVSF